MSATGTCTRQYMCAAVLRAFAGLRLRRVRSRSRHREGAGRAGTRRTVQGSATGERGGVLPIVQRRPAKECEKIALALTLHDTAMYPLLPSTLSQVSGAWSRSRHRWAQGGWERTVRGRTTGGELLASLQRDDALRCLECLCGQKALSVSSAILWISRLTCNWNVKKAMCVVET